MLQCRTRGALSRPSLLCRKVFPLTRLRLLSAASRAPPSPFSRGELGDETSDFYRQVTVKLQNDARLTYHIQGVAPHSPPNADADCVCRLIKEIQPGRVMLELCQYRLQLLHIYTKEEGAATMGGVSDMGGTLAAWTMFGGLLCFQLQDVVRRARKLGVPIFLCDVSGRILNHRVNSLKSVFRDGGIFAYQKISKSVRELQSREGGGGRLLPSHADALEDALDRAGSGLHRALVEDRAAFLSERVLSACEGLQRGGRGADVLVVCGVLNVDLVAERIRTNRRLTGEEVLRIGCGPPDTSRQVAAISSIPLLGVGAGAVVGLWMLAEFVGVDEVIKDTFQRVFKRTAQN
uniref:Uncharacterized protein n=1 Tax=Chromera velia CCMP2878 TaxID=1169474 RepID=A0A0G4FG21_9ALVE|eukprot:Cvel_3296.t1-p1 / transcript=Cvel_3296.t1 / gene=Cvel_3296 / organism=Chromera_velia_CCMP2878 / gene_product=hypothetical protein / transcript_product=hypothetical protein / location=Cvel_scaffold130:56951-59220(+) / protein_length=347 / sequence_SO=supercontig / SO=protein_coding / is_pseudo=false